MVVGVWLGVRARGLKTGTPGAVVRDGWSGEGRVAVKFQGSFL